MADNKEKLIAAITAGPIYAIGGMVFDCKGLYLFSTSELAELRMEVPVQRIDAGGMPTWIRRGDGDTKA